MRCEVCLPLVEAFFDGTLGELESGAVSAHLASCPVCSDALEAAQREQEMYAAYWREAGVNPPSWDSVLSAIEERRADSPAPARSAKWAAFLSPRRLTPALAAAAACAVLVICLPWLSRLAGRVDSPPRRESAARSGEAAAPSDEVLAAPATGAKDLTAGLAVPRVEPATPKPPPSGRADVKGMTADERRAEARLGKMTVAAGPAPSPAGDGRAPASNAAALFERTSTHGRETAAVPSLPSPGRAPGMGGETARHFERVQLLFLSLRQTAGEGQAIDLSYERELSRRLLNRNVLLRREAEMKGDLPLEELLDSVEPVFAEIANLPAQASPADVAQIKERIRKKGIVGLLKAQTAMLASEAERGRF
jgi:hypothetical protein